jgi:hypothetical protein
MWLDLLADPPRRATGPVGFTALFKYRKALSISE